MQDKVQNRSMVLTNRSKSLVFGLLFGAWIGLVYAYVTQAINWLYMPGINLTPPSGSVVGYIFSYILIGALVGLICSIPENRASGMILGGIVAAVLLAAATLIRGYQSDMVAGTVLLLLCSFMPLIVILTPLVILIRAGVDAQYVPSDQPELRARKFLIPAVLTIVVAGLGMLSLFSKDHRLAIQKVDGFIKEGQQASVEAELPEPLLDVPGFIENSHVPYTLTWSDRVDSFFGPRPAGAELSHFLVVASFENGFSFACVFSNNRNTPNCAPY